MEAFLYILWCDDMEQNDDLYMWVRTKLDTQDTTLKNMSIWRVSAGLLAGLDSASSHPPAHPITFKLAASKVIFGIITINHYT